jgi:hypothetical protein
MLTPRNLAPDASTLDSAADVEIPINAVRKQYAKLKSEICHLRADELTSHTHYSRLTSHV